MSEILIIKLGALGDFVQSLGVIKAIRRHYPGHRITLMTTKPFVGMAQACGYIDNVMLDPRPRITDFGAWWALRKEFRRFDVVIDLQNNDRTRLFYRPLYGLRGKWLDAQGPIARRRSKHVFEALKDIAARAGILGITHDDLSWVVADVSEFELPDPYVLFVAGCSPTRIVKRWPPENYAAVAKHVAAMGYTPVLLGTKDEADVNAAIAAASPEAIDLTGRTSLFQIAVLARHAAAAIGNDSGPLQMIGPTGCVTLGLFPGFSNPARHGPLGENVHTIQNTAMTDIAVPEVLEKLDSLLPSAG